MLESPIKTGTMYFGCLLITFANSLNPNQAQQNVGPDLGPNCLTLMVILKNFLKKSILKKIRGQINSIKNYPAGKELKATTFTQ